MKIENYSISLSRLDESNLEILRAMRNSEYVNSKMLQNDYITEEMQKKWFEKINNDQNYYFLAEYEGALVGVTHVKNIVDGSGEGGIFLAGDSFENTGVVPRIVLCFNDFIFNNLKLDFIYSQVKRTNKKAISSSIAQGCVEVSELSTDEVVYFRLYKANYIKKTQKLKKILTNG